MHPHSRKSRSYYQPAFIFLVIFILMVMVTVPVFADSKTGTSTNGKTTWKNRSASTDVFSLSIGNKPPQISGDHELSVTISEDSHYTLRLSGSDPNPGDALSWRISVPAQSGTASITSSGLNPELSYSPAADFSGSDTFTVQVSDLSGAVTLLPVKVTVLPANDFSEAR